MEALLFSFVAAALLAVGDRGQSLAALLTAKRRQPALVLAGCALSAGAVCAVAAYAGAALHDLITMRAQVLLIALALAYAGILGLFAPPPPGLAARFKGGSFLTALIFGFAFASGGRIQLLVLALASRVEFPWLAAAGGTLGILAATLPAVLLGQRLIDAPLRPWRIAFAILALLAAAIVLWNAPAS